MYQPYDHPMHPISEASRASIRDHSRAHAPRSPYENPRDGYVRPSEAGSACQINSSRVLQSERFLVSRVTHAASIQEDNVSFMFAFHLLVAARNERMRDLFRVALIHLATVSLDEKSRHGRAKIIHGRAMFATPDD